MSNINNKTKNMFNSTQNNTIKVLCALYELDINDVSKRYVCYIKSYSNDNNRTEDNAFNEFVKKELKKIEVFEKKDNANKKAADKAAKEAQKLAAKKANEEEKAILKAQKLADKEAKKLAAKKAKEEEKAILKAQKLADKEAKKLAAKKAKEEAKANKVVKVKKNKISDKKLKMIFSKAIKHTAKIAKQNIAKKLKLQKKEKALKALYMKNVKAAVKIGAKKLKQQLKEEKLAVKKANKAAKKANNAKKAIQAKKALKDDALKLLGNELKKEYSINVPESNNAVANAEKPAVAIVKKPVFYKPKVVLPYCGKVNKLACQAVRKNCGLYSQCQNKPAKNGVLCTTCEKNRNKREDKKPELGYITERGTKFVAKRFSEILKKKNIDKALAIEEAAKLGWVIPEHEFEIVKRVAGRPKKNKVVEVKEKKKRGRPLKNKNVEIVKGDTDLKQLIDNIKNDDIIDVEEYVQLEEEIEVLVEEEIEVINFMFNDTEYLKDTENIIYDINTQAEIGVYKKDLKHIEFY